MPHPPQELAYRCDEYGDFVLSVGRLDRAKRVDLLLEALAANPTLRGVIAGDGPDRERLEELAREQRARRARAVRRPRLERGAHRSLRALPAPSTTRRWTRTSGWFRTRRSWPRSRS